MLNLSWVQSPLELFACFVRSRSRHLKLSFKITTQFQIFHQARYAFRFVSGHLQNSRKVRNYLRGGKILPFHSKSCKYYVETSFFFNDNFFPIKEKFLNIVIFSMTAKLNIQYLVGFDNNFAIKYQ